MTKTLILMRHAKSSWDDPLQGDHARPLNKRGRRAAEALGDWLRARGYVPDQALVSDAARTRETWVRTGLNAPATFTETLYHAGPDRMLHFLRQATGHVVLMLGHNPGIAEFARQVVQAPPGHARFPDYPTGATLVARFDSESWQTIGWCQAQVLDFAVPRELQ